jgi:hypothetical protein
LETDSIRWSDGKKSDAGVEKKKTALTGRTRGVSDAP